MTPDPHPESWLVAFEPWSLQHGVTAAACTALMVGACVLGRQWRGMQREKNLRFAWIGFIVAWQVYDKLWWVLGTAFDPGESLPLHLCDVAAILAPLALGFQKRWMRTVLYFWAIGLSTQAFVTPTLTMGAGTTRYWLFWIGHIQIVGSAVYDIAVLGFRPGFRDYILGTIANFIYFAIILPIDIIWGLNYGYIGNALAEKPTLIDKLGPWPWRLIPLYLIVQIDMAILWLIWPISRRLAGKDPLGDDACADNPVTGEQGACVQEGGASPQAQHTQPNPDPTPPGGA